MRVVMRQQSSVLSINRTWMYRRPSSNSCSTQSTTFPRKPRYCWPGTKWRGTDRADLFFFMAGLRLFSAFANVGSLESVVAIRWRKFESFDAFSAQAWFAGARALRHTGLHRTYPNQAGQ